MSWGQSSDRSWHPAVVRVVVAGMATVAVSAVGATTIVPSMRTATINVAPLAAIDESSDTVGFADSDLYGMTRRKSTHNWTRCRPWVWRTFV